MFKKLKFWFEVIKGVINTYEEAVSTHGFNPLERSISQKKRTSNVQSNKAK